MLTVTSTINLILKVARPVLTSHAEHIEVQAEAERRWTRDAQAALKQRVYADNCATVRIPSSQSGHYCNV